MKRTALAFVLSLSFAGGCAAMDGNFVGQPAPTVQSQSKSAATSYQFEAMDALPPAPLKESVPELTATQVWVPGYYEPVAGTWLWHQGEVRELKEGYRLMPASYHAESGKIYFTPPRWRRADLASATGALKK